MRGYSLVLVLLVGAVLAPATAHRRRSVDDRDAENQVDSAESSAERDPEPEERYRQHNQHRDGRRHFFGRLNRRGFNLSQAEEVIDFHQHFMHDVRRLATASRLSSSDINTLMNIFEENRAPFKPEDRSQWTEEQWQKSKEERDQRRQLISNQAFEQIPDAAHLAVFFKKLEAEKQLIRENMNRRILANLIWIAKRSGMSKAQILTFVRELESHKPVGLHWRPGMSENEKKKNLQIRLRNWQEIKEACLRDASELEQMQFNRFFARVEQAFANHAEGGHRRMSHQHRRRRLYHYSQEQNDDEDPSPRQSLREHGRRYRNNNDDSNEVRSERHRLRRHRGRRDFDGEDVEEAPRRFYTRRQYHRQLRHESDDGDTSPMRFRHYRRHHRRDSEQSEERDVPREHRRHEVEDSEETEEAPIRYNRRHHLHHHHHHHQPKRQPEGTNDSDEQRDEQRVEQRDEAPRHLYRNHYRRHESAENDDAKARFERDPLPARHFRRGDGPAQE